MAKRKASSLLKSAKVFVNEIDEAIEQEVYVNADTIGTENAKSGYLKQTHKIILEVLDIQSIDDSKYFDYEVYKSMVKEKVILRRERKKKSEERKAKEEAKEEQAKTS